MDYTQYIPANAFYAHVRSARLLTVADISNPATWSVTVKRKNINEKGALITPTVGMYLKDFVGHTFQIIAVTDSNNFNVEDVLRCGKSPVIRRDCVIYKSVGNGEAPLIAPIDYSRLDWRSLHYSMAIELDILWKKASSPVFNGACVIPTLTDNGDGTVTISDGHYHLATTDDGHDSDTFIISGNTFTLNNLQQNYIVANYNSGDPVIQLTTDVTVINETTIVPVFSIFRNGTYLHIQNWDSLGIALANKVHQSIVKTQRYRRESGLMLSEYGTRNLHLTAGKVWIGAVQVTLSEIYTAADNLFFWYHSGGTWTVSVQTQYNNSQYDNGTNLATLTVNRYAVNWVFRGVESQKHLYVVIGTGDYTLNQAQAATIPTLPIAISSHAVLVAKLIVQNGASTAVSIQSAFDTQLSAAPTANHTDLTNLAWTSSGHTDGNNSIAYFNASGVASVINNSIQSLSGTTISWNITNGIHATLTISGNTTITLSNLMAGISGNLSITNPSTLYTLTVSGYTNKISPSAYLTSNQLKVSGSSKLDVFSWYYDGTYLWWNGGQDYK